MEVVIKKKEAEPKWGSNNDLEALLYLLDEIPEQMCSSPQPEFLYSLAKSVPLNGTIVEIGTCAGKSLISMAMARRGIGGNKITSIDFIKHPKIQEHIRRAGIEDWVDLILGESAKVAKTWVRPIDLLWIDGDHRSSYVRADIRAWSKYVVVDGMMAFHDYCNRTGVHKAVMKEVISKPWRWQVVSDREYGSIFVVKRLQSENNGDCKWREKKQRWLHSRMRLARNERLKQAYRISKRLLV